MKSLDDIVKDFETQYVEGEGEVLDGDTSYLTDFSAEYSPKDENAQRLLEISDGLRLYQIELDDTYQPTSFNVSENFDHDLTPKMSIMQSLLEKFLMCDPCWVFSKFGSNVKKLNTNLYTVEVSNKTGALGKVLNAQLIKTVEFHVSDDEVLTKLKIVDSAIINNMTTDLGSKEITFQSYS